MLPALAARMGDPPQPERLQGGFGGVYENVARLEEQQTGDRAFMAQLARAVRSLEDNFSKAHRRLESVEEEVRGPRRDYTIRQEMREMKARLEADVVSGHEQIHNTVGPRMAELQVLMTEMQVAMTNFRDKEAMIEKYIANLEDQRPQEGQKVISGFELVQNEITSVREMVRRLESQPRAAVPVQAASTFNEELRAAMTTIHKATEENGKGLFELSVNLANIGIASAQLHDRVHLLENTAQKLILANQDAQ